VTPEQRLETFRKLVEKSPDDPFTRYSLAGPAVGRPQARQPRVRQPRPAD
jgi:hypothetical protein